MSEPKKPRVSKGRPHPGGTSQVIGYGIQQEAKAKFGSKVTDPGHGKHLWIYAAAWAVADPAEVLASREVHLDVENLLSIEGPGCFKCEKLWSLDVGRRFCQGVMS